MDRRSLIAIFLTFMLLLFWQIFFISPQQREREAERRMGMEDTLQKKPMDEEVDVESRGGAGEVGGEQMEVGDLSGKEAGFILEDEPVEELNLTVRTHLAEYKLSSLGGELRNVKLMEYPGLNGMPVDIVPEGSRGGAMVSFTTMKGEIISLSGELFRMFLDGELVESSGEVYIDEEGEKAEIVFRKEGSDGCVIEKRFNFQSESYEVYLKISIKREGEIRNTEKYQLLWDCGMAVTEEDRAGDIRNFAALGKVGEEIYEESMDDFDKGEKKEHEGTVVWSGARSKYFLTAFIPGRRRAGSLVMYGDEEETKIAHGIAYSFRGDPRRVEDEFICYLGPLDIDTLEEYDIGLEKTVELGWLRFFSVFILKLMIFLRRFIPNYGVIIVLVSLMTKFLFYRLTHKSFKSMKEMQKIQPKIKELQEKYKDDKEKLNKEMMKVYKEGGVNPLGGCLPLLLQMPVFIALFNVLRNTIEIRKAPFVLWINDLSSPDVLFDMGVSIPFLGSEFHLLPILMGGAMYLQSKLGGSPTGGTAPAAQAKMMSTFMPIIFTFFFYRMPSGLVLYWLVNNIISIIQQYYIHRDMDDTEEGSEDVSGKKAKGTKNSR
jgi:YidC/Oxa1 family membrane protein insertase